MLDVVMPFVVIMAAVLIVALLIARLRVQQRAKREFKERRRRLNDVAMRSPREHYRVKVCDWLRANGVDPAVVPLDVEFDFTEPGRVSFDAYKSDEHGRKQLDPADPNRVWTERVTVPVKVPFVGDLDDALTKARSS